MGRLATGGVPADLPMRLALIARAEDRGLGLQSRDFAQHLRPSKVLVVDTSAHARLEDVYPLHPEWYPGARFAQVIGGRIQPPDVLDWLLTDIDVVFCAETAYDPGFYALAKARNVRTVCQVNWEFWRAADAQPDLIVVPTQWNADRIPGAMLLPHGVDRERFVYRHHTTARRFLHVAGHPAMGDRAGTSLVIKAAQHVDPDLSLTIRSQRPETIGPVPHNVEVLGPVDDPAELYEGYDVLVAPRRYGGQSLPVNEALSCGLPVIATERDPERSWPGVVTVPIARSRLLRTHAQTITSESCDPLALADTINCLASSPDEVAALSSAADERAQAISWQTMTPEYLRLFAQVCG